MLLLRGFLTFLEEIISSKRSFPQPALKFAMLYTSNAVLTSTSEILMKSGVVKQDGSMCSCIWRGGIAQEVKSLGGGTAESAAKISRSDPGSG